MLCLRSLVDRPLVSSQELPVRYGPTAARHWRRQCARQPSNCEGRLQGRLCVAALRHNLRREVTLDDDCLLHDLDHENVGIPEREWTDVTRHGGAERLETKTDCWISCLDQVGGIVPSPLTAIDLVASKPTSTSTYIALLRGINVGGRNRLSMNALSTMFEDAGCLSVRTYIQSGNVIFASTPTVSQRARESVAATVSDTIGTQVPIILRSIHELTQVVAGNPFLSESQSLRTLHVGFLADKPPSSLVSCLDPNRSPPDAFAVRGSEIYLHLPNGVARTRFTAAYLERTLATQGTFRNWRTVVSLLRIATG